MPARLTPPIVEDFPLEKTDARAKEQGQDVSIPTTVRIRQAAQGERERRDKVFQDFTREYEGMKILVKQAVSYSDLVRIECMLTMAACNLEDTDGKILFEFKDGHVVDEVKFQQAWYKLDPLTADEIHEQVLKINLLWSEPGK